MSTIVVPPEPNLGDPLPIGGPAPETLALLARRRSTSAQTLTTPGPGPAELAEMIRLAARVPDHGKLVPWRFLIIEGQAKAELLDKLAKLALDQPSPGKAGAVLGKLRAPPVSVAVISRTDPEAAIPVWEQELSAGAVCMTFLIAAQAMGFGANWITDWYSYAPEAAALFGLAAQEKIAGFIHLGTPAEPPAERARPDLGSIVTRL